MRHGTGTSRFDTSDTQVDNLDAILDVAAEVLLDYGGEGGTRIQRLARYVAMNLGGGPYSVTNEAGSVAYYTINTGREGVGDPAQSRVWRMGDSVGSRKVLAHITRAREFVVAYLRAIELAERAE